MILLMSFSASAFSETYFCSFISENVYSGEKQLRLWEIRVNGKEAHIGDGIDEFKVLENNEYGIVIVETHSAEAFNRPRNAVGLRAVIIDKKTLDFNLGDLIMSNRTPIDKRVKTGNCKRVKN